MSGRVRGSALALPLALLAAIASAQEHPGHGLDREKEEKPKPRLSLDLAAEESWESNVPYTQLLGQDDFVTRANARLAAALPIRRGTVELGAEGGANVYRTMEGLDRYTWGVDASLEHRFSRRSDVDVKLRSARELARDNQRMEVNGAVAPLTPMRNDSADGTWRKKIGRRLTLRLDARGESFRFDSPQLQDGWSAGARMGLENAFGERLALGVETLYGRTATEAHVAFPPLVAARAGATIEVLSGVGTAKIVPARRFEVRLKAGVARFGAVGDPVLPPGAATGDPDVTGIDPALQEPQTTPQLEADVDATFGKHVLTAIASRRIEQSYGIGAIGINRVLSIGYRGQLAPWVALTLIGTDNHNSAPDATLLSSGRTASAGLDFTMPGEFAARVTYSYWDRHDPERDWRSHTVAAALSKKFDWR